MTFGIDFDGVLVDKLPLRLKPGARLALRSLRAAGHLLVLHSGRLSPPGGDVPPGTSPSRYAAEWGEARREAWEYSARHRLEMFDFLRAESLLGLFDEVWDRPGKPWHVDAFVDDKAVPFGGRGGSGWARIAEDHGEPSHGRLDLLA